MESTPRSIEYNIVQLDENPRYAILLVRKLSFCDKINK